MTFKSSYLFRNSVTIWGRDVATALLMWCAEVNFYVTTSMVAVSHAIIWTWLECPPRTYCVDWQESRHLGLLQAMGPTGYHDKPWQCNRDWGHDSCSYVAHHKVTQAVKILSHDWPMGKARVSSPLPFAYNFTFVKVKILDPHISISNRNKISYHEKKKQNSKTARPLQSTHFYRLTRSDSSAHQSYAVLSHAILPDRAFTNPNLTAPKQWHTTFLKSLKPDCQQTKCCLIINHFFTYSGNFEDYLAQNKKHLKIRNF